MGLGFLGRGQRHCSAKEEGAMLLVMDVGNTTTVVGIFDGKKLTAHWRLSSILHTSDELGIYLLTLLGTKGVGPEGIDGAVFASVVPPLDLLVSSRPRPLSCAYASAATTESPAPTVEPTGR